MTPRKSLILLTILCFSCLCGCATRAYVRAQTAAPTQRRVRDVTSFNTPMHVSTLTNKFTLTCVGCGAVATVHGSSFQNMGGSIENGQPFQELRMSRKCKCCKLTSSYYFKVWAPLGTVRVVQDLPPPPPQPTTWLLGSPEDTASFLAKPPGPPGSK